jgi:hypothetical protein
VRRRRRLVISAGALAAAFACVLAVPGRASAEPEKAELDYARDPSIESCPTETQLRDAVTARLGYEPFTREAPRTVVVRIQRERVGLRATVAVAQRNGARLERAPIVSSTTDCREVAETLSLAISIAIDPLSVTRPSPSPSSVHLEHPPALEEATPPARGAEPAPAILEPAAVQAKRAPIDVRMGIHGGVSLGLSPGPSANTSAFVGVGIRSLSFNVEGVHDFGASTTGPSGGTVTSSLDAGAFVPCLELGMFAGCGRVALGAFSGEGADVKRARTQTDFFAAAGLRIVAEVRVVKWLGLRAHIDGAYTLTPITMQIARADAFRTPALSGGLGIGATVHFP